MASDKTLDPEANAFDHDTVEFSNIGLEIEIDSEATQEFILEKEPVSRKPEDESRFKIEAKTPRERRNWKRFAIDGAIAMIMKPSLVNFLKPTYIKLGPVKDIGMKGLAVHYVDKEEGLNFKKAPYLSIMLPGEGIVVDKVPFKIVNTFKVADLPGGKEVWNLCVMFEKLLPVQKIQIESFIDYYGNELKSKLVK